MFVNLLRSPGIDSSLADLYDNPICRTGPPCNGGIDSSESIPGLLERLQIWAPYKEIIDLKENCNKNLKLFLVGWMKRSELSYVNKWTGSRHRIQIFFDKTNYLLV